MHDTTNSKYEIQDESAHIEPPKIQMRYGSTNFEVAIYFSTASKETLEDKILRLVEKDICKDF